MKATMSTHKENSSYESSNSNTGSDDTSRTQQNTPGNTFRPPFPTDRDLIVPAIFVFVCGALVMGIIAIIFLTTACTPSLK